MSVLGTLIASDNILAAESFSAFECASALPPAFAPDLKFLRARFAPPVIFQIIPFSSIHLAKRCAELGIYNGGRLRAAAHRQESADCR
jgi:hypothetical protein